MTTHSSIRPFAAVAVALSLSIGSIASAAPTSVSSVNPLVALSAFGSTQSRAALCAAASAAVAAAPTTAAQGKPGCVLPVADAPLPPVASDVPPPVAPYRPAYAAAAAPNLLPLLAALGLFGGVFFLLDDQILGDDDGFQILVPPQRPPVSPT